MKRLVLVLLFLANASFAVEPHEMLEDTALEDRAREISKGLRCPVCQNESIDESDAVLAAQLRVLLRERLLAGDSDQEAIDFLVARFGEFVLLQPDARGANLFLWLSAPSMLLVALGIGWSVIRRKPAEEESLSDAEKAELEKILRS